MVRASYDQKPYRRILMETYGVGGRRRARRRTTNYGRKVLAETPDNTGLAGHRDQRGGRGRRDPRRTRSTRSGSVLRLRAAAPDGHRPGGDRADGDGRRGARRDHRLRRRRLELRRADVPVPRPEAARRRAVPRIIAVEPEAAPSLTRGVYAYDFGDTAQDGAAREDAHARPRLHPGADPRRRAPLPRHVAARVAAQGPRRHRGPQRPPARRASRPASSSPEPRASCRRPSRPTRSRSRSTRRSTRKAGERAG